MSQQRPRDDDGLIMTGCMLWCSFYDVYEHASAEDKKTTMYSGDGEMEGGRFLREN